MNVSEYILSNIQKKYNIEENADLETFNYIESGFVDSLGIIQFIIKIEDDFNIEFTNDELASPSFKIVGELIRLIEGKVMKNEKS